MAVAIHDIAPGLWLWRQDHPDWTPGHGWDPTVTSVCVESGGEVALLDPLAPPDGDPVWERLEAEPPTLVAILKPDHIRDVDRFASRYGARAYGPRLFFPADVPQTRLEPIFRGNALPGGLLALDDGRGAAETPLYLPEQRTLVFADGLTAPDGELRVWDADWHERRTLPALREFLDLPFERVIVSHGAPVHDRAAFERALELPPYHEPES
jgi:hypothetical protein